ncbi:polyadenylate-binding protein RBP47A-like [Brassica napus]|uniref:polyadenylate-binding protein RBP47A-like n=1 Tax=Brassica napus TaxID=3708 RepID=UPI002078C58E|nr:polyadenylate-binding protein RBP47A-like [Brassica napus]
MQTANNGQDSSSATAAGTTPPLQQPPPPPPQQQQQWQQHQQWMAAMAMMQQQQMMMYPPQYAPYHHHPQFQYAPPSYHQKNQQQRGGGDDVKTLWIGDLLHWMDETYLHTCFSHTNQVSSVKVIRNKQTCQSEGYGFVEFLSRSAAEEVLQSYSGVTMPNAEQPFRLNWASFSTGEKRASENGPDLSIFVGDLAPDVTDTVLLETFAVYQSVKGAKVVIDSNTGRSKGYGFVRFGDENERSKALTEMNGAFCSSRQMRVGVATPKRAAAYGQQNGSQALTLAGGHGGNGSMADGESNNSTIFVGGLDADVTEEDLMQRFSQFGEVVSVKIPVGKGCGFVQFGNRQSAEEAIGSLNGTVIGKNTVRLSWGRSPNKQWRSDSGNQWNGGYSRGQGYNNGYANQDSNMYATAAAAVPGAS